MRMTLLAITVSAALALAASPARGAMLATAPAQAIGFIPGGYMYCQATNAGNKPIDQTIEGVKYDGSVGDSAVPTVDPGQATSLLITSNAAYCRFTFSGGKRALRAAAVYYDSNSATYMMAIPAQ